MVLFPVAILPLVFGKEALVFGGIAFILFAVGISWTLINIANSLILTNISSEQVKGQVFGVSGVLGALIGGYLAKFLDYLGAFWALCSLSPSA